LFVFLFQNAFYTEGVLVIEFSTKVNGLHINIQFAVKRIYTNSCNKRYKNLFLHKNKIKMSLTIQLPMTTEHYLRENATREGMTLERYIAQLLTVVSAKKQKKSLTEAELLEHCQLAVQTDDLAEYHRLRTLYKSNTLTNEERESLIQLNELIEIAHAKRMGYVLQLAQLRHISLEKAMHDLGIKHLSE
jgi:hypothetical protein